MIYKTDEIQRKEVRGVKINLSAEARVTNTSVKTIKKRLGGECKGKCVQLRTSKLDDYKDLIIEKIDKLQVTAKAIYEFIKTKGYTGSYETVKIFVRRHRKKAYKETFIRVLRTPGLQAQVDWKESKTFISKSGVPYEVNIFAYILCYSQYRFYKLTTNRKQDTLFKCLVEAFKVTYGVPNEIWFDNMKTVVQYHDHNTNLTVFQPNLLQFAKDCSFTPIACRNYRPQTKGLVEGAVKLLNRLDVYNEEFDDLDGLEQIVNNFNISINNELNHFTSSTGFEMLQKEKEHLLPLGNIDMLFSYTTNDRRVVSHESMISYMNNKYSVPIDYIGETVTIQVNDNQLYIYYNSKFVNSHTISSNKLNYDRNDYKDIILHSIECKNKSEDEIQKILTKRMEEYDKLYNKK